MKMIASSPYQMLMSEVEYLVSDTWFAAPIPYLLIPVGKRLTDAQIKTETPQTATPPLLSVYYLIGSITK